MQKLRSRSRNGRECINMIPFSILQQDMGGLAANTAKILLITSVFAALLSFHNTVARYVFGMARDRVLPPSFGRVGTGARAGAPIAGSLMQSLIADGSVTFEGRQYVKNKGVSRRKIQPAKLELLFQKLEEIHLWSLDAEPASIVDREMSARQTGRSSSGTGNPCGTCRRRSRKLLSPGHKSKPSSFV